MTTPRRILVVRTDRVGDLILATPLIRALRRAFPDSYLAILASPYAAPVLEANPHLNAVLTDRAGQQGSDGFWKQVRVLRRHAFDTALLLWPTKRLAWMLCLAGIPTRIGVGRKPYQMLTLTRWVDRHRHRGTGHEADHCLDLGRAIGAGDAGLKPELFLTDDERQWGRAALDQTSPGLHWVMVHASCGASSPNWSTLRYRELAMLLLEDPRTGIVMGTANQPDPFRLESPRVADFMGSLSLRQLMSVIANCSVVVASSTGPMHIAAALGVPTVALFCTLPACAPQRWRPLGNRDEVILPDAAFCHQHCIQDTHGCTFDDGIAPETVRAAVRSMLGHNSPTAPVVSGPSA